MGQILPLFSPHLWKEDEPESFAPYKYDHRFGFEESGLRVEKKIPVTQQELDSACIEDVHRDFCADIRIQFRGCVRDHSPFWFYCKGLYHEMAKCYESERIHDMKEFEREKRLNIRERRIRAKQE